MRLAPARVRARVSVSTLTVRRWPRLITRLLIVIVVFAGSDSENLNVVPRAAALVAVALVPIAKRDGVTLARVITGAVRSGGGTPSPSRGGVPAPPPLSPGPEA